MIHRVTFLVLALAALFALQFADCFSPVSADQQTMQCCGSMPCNPANQSHDCCKTMVSSPSPSVLPVEHIALNVPVVAVVDNLTAPEVVVIAEFSPSRFEAPQHSPPELYALHSSLLI
ncbi:MAG TPA: hypothetical protein VNO32_23280 [Candidatus Acidoferrum sp.]|jgi:hypothetical protein|nr:hypothetical protein [Candidatus Acidoferrum sp.]